MKRVHSSRVSFLSLSAPKRASGEMASAPPAVSGFDFTAAVAVAAVASASTQAWGWFDMIEDRIPVEAK
jgi:hypothetical protein